MSDPGLFACTGCGKQYRWKPELAGKRVKCTCGTVMTAPADSGAGEPDLYALAADADKALGAGRPHDKPQRGEAGLCPGCGAALQPSAVLCVHCGYNLKTGAKVQTQVQKGAPAAKPKPGKGGSNVLGYAADPRASRAREEVSAIEGTPFKDLWLPIILILIGTALSIWAYSRFDRMKLPFAFIRLGIVLVVDMAMIFGGGLLAVKFMSIALGAPAQAMLKICAVSVLPGSISYILACSFLGGDYVGWAASLFLYYGLLSLFFDLDFGEVVTLVGIIWLVRTWAGYFLAGLLVAAILGGNANIPAAVGPMVVGPGIVDDEDIIDPNAPKGPTAAQFNGEASGYLAGRGVEEAQGWLNLGENRLIIGRTSAQSKALVEQVYRAGAEQVWVAAIGEEGDNLVAGALVVELRKTGPDRKKLIDWHNAFIKQTNPDAETMPDVEQQRFVIDLEP